MNAHEFGDPPADFAAFLDEQIAAIRFEAEMAMAMWWNEGIIGVPYGPALCQAHPPELKGIQWLIDNDWAQLDE